MSRATDVNNIAFFCDKEQVLEYGPSVVNVLYPKIPLGFEK